MNSLSPVCIPSAPERPYLLRSTGRMIMQYGYCLLNTFYVLRTFHSNVQSFPMKQDFYFLRFTEGKRLVQGHDTKKRQSPDLSDFKVLDCSPESTGPTVQQELCGLSFPELVATWTPTLVLPGLQMLPIYYLGRNVALLPATQRLCPRHLSQTVGHIT